MKVEKELDHKSTHSIQDSLSEFSQPSSHELSEDPNEEGKEDFSIMNELEAPSEPMQVDEHEPWNPEILMASGDQGSEFMKEDSEP